jgi:hypothetical protein
VDEEDGSVCGQVGHGDMVEHCAGWWGKTLIGGIDSGLEGL